jgi:hypothetical protein
MITEYKGYKVCATEIINGTYSIRLIIEDLNGIDYKNGKIFLNTEVEILRLCKEFINEDDGFINFMIDNKINELSEFFNKIKSI